MDKTHIL